MVKSPQDQNYVPEAVDWALSDGHSLQDLRSDSRLLQKYVNKEKSLQQDRKAWGEKQYEMRKASKDEQRRNLAAERQEDEEWRKELGKMYGRGDPRAWKAWDKVYKEWVEAGRPKEGDEAYKKWIEAGRGRSSG
jgi:hypothetical protein